MKLVLVWDLLLLPFIVRYCVASDPSLDFPSESDTTSSSISLLEKTSNRNPASASRDVAQLQRPESSPDHPFDVGESRELLSQSKSDDCLSDETQTPSRRKRFRRQFCPSQLTAPNSASKNPVTIPSIPIWRDTDINLPKQVPFSGPTEDLELCADDWINVPVCAKESSAIGDYLPSCRLST